MRIDLRYVIPVVMFYLPGVLVLLGGLALGYSIAEIRLVVAIFGILCGFMLSAISGIVMFTADDPIWLNLPWRAK